MAVARLWPLAWRRTWRFPLEVLLTRVGPGTRPLDGDGLQAALKAVRDQVAHQLGVDDGDSRIRWTYAQERGPYAVRIGVRYP